MKKKICIVLGSRANYSSIKSAMCAIEAHPDLELQVLAGASAILDRYGRVVDLVRADGFKINEEVYMIIEGETPTTMAQSTGVGLMALPTAFERLSPDVVLTVGDRYETMATTLAAAYMNIPIAHTMGGEVSGTIDESIRHAVTKFAHIHFPASKDAADRILKLGERPDMIFNVGCPRMDLVKEIIESNPPLDARELFTEGVGSEQFDLDAPFLLVSQHPVTTEFGKGEQQITATLQACQNSKLPTVVLWPNSDAGSDDIARGMRKWRERGNDENMHFFKNLPIHIYVRLMRMTACLLGNSSSGIREGAFIGTPVVNIGSRQDMRERGDNVLDVGNDTVEIEGAVSKQLEHGFYGHQPIYGDGTAGEKIADVLSKLGEVEVQKRITY
ncbi:UDP-N-acetylglucosamine 2-epimerase [Akkermansiaceae bacterium]|nr:UDP-N-acetylglucosamine 2-epimerase [Akkermansiaceae bacterium]MDA7875343.1 UDP-N-acetylglucosamine 2-epimerase [Akkermansiaceae bacterium]MDA7908788.1 UDP-N-acetylglucosamine 2-epimerase [Akkermansiaceae bacterium]MDC0301386.1 UDP-N-acetylglucosamine 2-epimerase [Akkermansiaceae bacterium]